MIQIYCKDLQGQILVKTDRSSMLNSLELRSPFLDHRLVEFAFKNIPSKMKATSKERKIILKELCKKILPNEFNNNRKQGFSLPLDEWLKKGDFRDLFWDVLSSKDMLLNKNYIQKLLHSQDKGFRNSERLFALVQLELWRKNYNCYL